MEIQYLSDIHLELMTKVPKIKVLADVLCLAGDIGYPYSGIYKDFLIKVNRSFKKVFLICGNHEYYMLGKNSVAHTMDDIKKMIRALLIIHKLTNVTFLDNSIEIYNGYTFAGTTLWTHLSQEDQDRAANTMNDYANIQGLTPALSNTLHKESCTFIEHVMATAQSPVIMLTHHVPSYSLLRVPDCFYASDCTRYFCAPIKAWIYGHTHVAHLEILENIVFACNPKGYPCENTILFGKTIEC